MLCQLQEQDSWQGNQRDSHAGSSGADTSCDLLPLSTSPSRGLPPSQAGFCGTEPVRPLSLGQCGTQAHCLSMEASHRAQRYISRRRVLYYCTQAQSLVLSSCDASLLMLCMKAMYCLTQSHANLQDERSSGLSKPSWHTMACVCANIAPG